MQDPAKVRGIFSAIADRYDLANHVLSGGLAFLWRAKAVRMVRAWQPARILDLATGSGDLALAMQKAMPESTIVGADFCLPMLLVAARKGLRPLPGWIVEVGYELRPSQLWPVYGHPSQTEWEAML